MSYDFTFGQCFVILVAVFGALIIGSIRED